MTKIGIITVLLCCLLTTMVSAGESYLCVADMATGFKYNKTIDKWESVNFNVDDSKYIVSRSKAKNTAWEVKQIGQQYPLATCKDDFGENGYLFCELVRIFKMNKINLRFICIYPFGYYNESPKGKKDVFYKDGADSPHVEIGKCSPLP